MGARRDVDRLRDFFRRPPVKGGYAFYGRIRLNGKDERRAVKQALRNGREPLPRYFEGPLWLD